jgi:hypothetical protein
MTKAHMAFQNGAGLINKEVSIDLPKNTQNYPETPKTTTKHLKYTFLK